MQHGRHTACMCRDGPTVRPMGTLLGALVLVGLAGCHRGSQVVTSIEFDGKSRTISTDDVTCTKQLDGGLLILVLGGPQRTVRVLLTEQGRLAVQKAALRYDDLAGFVADPGEVTATKVDDTFTFSGRMPPNPGEAQWHTFKIETTCPAYQEAPPSPQFPRRGAP